MNALWQRIWSSFDRQRFLALLGARLESVEPGRVCVSCRRRLELTQQQGLLHGGVITAVADVACGYAALTTVPEGREILTAELKINLLRPVTGEHITATGTVIKSGRTLVVAEAEVIDTDSGKLAAKALATIVPVPEQPGGAAPQARDVPPA